jgi:hypothetical protein
MSAEVIAIGPYSSDIAKFLDYPEKYYSAVANGHIPHIFVPQTRELEHHVSKVFDSRAQFDG